MGWTKERLEEVARTRQGGAKLIVVGNREPYVHRFRDGEVEWYRQAGGMTTALDPVMRTCGGTWVAHGSGDAEPETFDKFGRVSVPPDDPNYTLRRVWLTKEQEEGYYSVSPTARSGRCAIRSIDCPRSIPVSRLAASRGLHDWASDHSESRFDRNETVDLPDASETLVPDSGMFVLDPDQHFRTILAENCPR